MSLPLEKITCGWPTETSSFTCAPLATFVPPGGSVANRVPTGASLNCLTSTGTMPLSATVLANASSFAPATAGTTMSAGPAPAAPAAAAAAAAPPFLPLPLPLGVGDALPLLAAGFG
jgi:hypothetical protein